MNKRARRDGPPDTPPPPSNNPAAVMSLPRVSPSDRSIERSATSRQVWRTRSRSVAVAFMMAGSFLTSNPADADEAIDSPSDRAVSEAAVDRGSDARGVRLRREIAPSGTDAAEAERRQYRMQRARAWRSRRLAAIDGHYFVDSPRLRPTRPAVPMMTSRYAPPTIVIPIFVP